MHQIWHCQRPCQNHSNIYCSANGHNKIAVETFRPKREKFKPQFKFIVRFGIVDDNIFMIDKLLSGVMEVLSHTYDDELIRYLFR